MKFRVLHKVTETFEGRTQCERLGGEAMTRMTVEEIIASLTPKQVFECFSEDDPWDWIFWNLLDPNGLTIDPAEQVEAAMHVIFDREEPRD